MKFISSLFLLLFLSACGTGPCREPRPPMTDAESAVSQQVKPSERVRVFKLDGSLQCGMGKAISPAEMQKQLQGIKVHSAASKTDGLMRIQVCGQPTGQSNVYEIDRADLEKAQKAGFKEWTWD